MAYYEDSETDDSLADGFPSEHKHSHSASSDKKGKQSGSNYEVKNLKEVNRNNDNIHMIQKCIGQIMIDFDGTDHYFYGTGTVYKVLRSTYCLVITCAHNLIDEVKNRKEPANALFFLPEGTQNDGKRLQCIEWIAHPDYNISMKHCENDLGIVLCYDASKYYKKEQNITKDSNDIIEFATHNESVLENCNLYGYPVKVGGKLMGNGGGTAKKDKNEWNYENMNTYPGQSGSSLYNVQYNNGKYKFIIRGIHTFGDVQKQYNTGVQLDENKIKWIQSTEEEMLKSMEKHRKLPKSEKNKKAKKQSKVRSAEVSEKYTEKKEMDPNTEVSRFLELMECPDLRQRFYDERMEEMSVMRSLTHDILKTEFGVHDLGGRMKILDGIKQYFPTNSNALVIAERETVKLNSSRHEYNGIVMRNGSKMISKSRDAKGNDISIICKGDFIVDGDAIICTTSTSQTSSGKGSDSGAVTIEILGKLRIKGRFKIDTHGQRGQFIEEYEHVDHYEDAGVSGRISLNLTKGILFCSEKALEIDNEYIRERGCYEVTKYNDVKIRCDVQASKELSYLNKNSSERVDGYLGCGWRDEGRKIQFL